QVSIIGRRKRNFGRCGKHQQTVHRISGTSLQTESSIMTETVQHKAHASQPHNYSQLDCFLMEFVNASHLPSPTSQTLNPKLVKECVCPTARPKRPTNQRTKKNTEPITGVWLNGGFSVSYDSFVVG